MFLISNPLGGTTQFIKSVGEEYQDVKRGREYHGSGEECNVEKRSWESNIIFILIIKPLLGRKSSGGRGRKFWGRK